jgi:GDP-L-fucose synthase
MQGYFSDKRVVVTGGAGFLGRSVVRKLEARGCASLVVPRRASCDLRKWEDVCRLLDATEPNIIVHLAGVVAGIGGTRHNPAGSFYDNLMMGTQLLEAARQRRVDKVVILGTVCSYPKLVSIPAREEEFWNGYPEETNAPYGLAKKILLVQSQAYRQQYALNSIYLVSANLYGPGDNFDLETSHVIPALIRRFFEAVQNDRQEVICWGDGTPTREFLYVDDCAEAILLATQHYNDSAPVNLGTGVEIPIRNLALWIAGLAGFRGRIAWDSSKPNGQPRRCWDVSRAEKAFGFRARTELVNGLAETIAWYRKNLSEQRSHEQDFIGLPEY